MAKGGKRQQPPKKKKGSEASASGESLIWVDPARVRFQHSKIRPYFSGCGRSVVSTLEQIRNQELRPADLPPIQVLVGPEDKEDGFPWYFSLNNRRLWVLKRCREEGLLEETDNRIQVRVRQPKSEAERKRYTLENCALEAKFLSERKPPSVECAKAPEQVAEIGVNTTNISNEPTHGSALNTDNEDDGSSSSDEDGSYRPHNPFKALL